MTEKEIKDILDTTSLLMDKAIRFRYSRYGEMFQFFGICITDSCGNKRDVETVARELGEALIKWKDGHDENGWIMYNGRPTKVWAIQMVHDIRNRAAKGEKYEQ